MLPEERTFTVCNEVLGEVYNCDNMSLNFVQQYKVTAVPFVGTYCTHWLSITDKWFCPWGNVAPYSWLKQGQTSRCVRPLLPKVLLQ